MRRILATLAVVGALLFGAGSSWADWDDVWRALKRGDYATAFIRVATACRAGSCFGHKFNLGLMYSNGEGVPKSDAEVVGSYRKAADLPAFLWLSFHS